MRPAFVGRVVVSRFGRLGVLGVIAIAIRTPLLTSGWRVAGGGLRRDFSVEATELLAWN